MAPRRCHPVDLWDYLWYLYTLVVDSGIKNIRSPTMSTLKLIADFWKSHYGSDVPADVEDQLLAIQMLKTVSAKGNDDKEALAWIVGQLLHVNIEFARSGELPILEEFRRLRLSGWERETAIQELLSRHVRVSAAYNEMLFRRLLDEFKE